MKEFAWIISVAVVAIILVISLQSCIDKHEDDDFDRIELENKSLKAKLTIHENTSFSIKYHIKQNKKSSSWGINTDNFYAVHINKPDPKYEMHIQVWFEVKDETSF